MAGLLWLVARGTFLGPRHTAARSLVLGIATGCAVLFVYVYNAFLVPGILLAVAWWAWRGTGSARDVLRHVTLTALGTAIAAVAYFALVYVAYGHSPAVWYDTWLAMYYDSGRAAGFTPSGLWTLLEGNAFRLDRPFMVVTLLALPAFAWWTRRSGDRLGIATLSLAAAFAAQAAIQSDYPERKMLILLAFAVPIAAGGVLRAGAWRSWLAERRGRTVAAVAWLAIVIAGTLLIVLPPAWTHWPALARALDLPRAASISYRVGPAGKLIVAGALVGVVAIVALLAGWRRVVVARVAGVVLLGAMLVPLLYLDRAHVFAHVRTTYRDALIEVRPVVDGQTTAGSLSFGMQLYNTGMPVLEGYVYGMTRAEYEAAVVRFFEEGRATALFSYATGESLARWTNLGFRLVETYDMVLPKREVMGRYVFDPPAGRRRVQLVVATGRVARAKSSTDVSGPAMSSLVRPISIGSPAA